jgi:hypothetical protein
MTTETIEQHPVCAACGYNRAGLPEATPLVPCPECGANLILRPWPGWRRPCLAAAVPAWLVGLALAALPSADLLNVQVNAWLIFSVLLLLLVTGVAGPLVVAMRYGTRGEDVGFRPTRADLHFRCVLWTWIGAVAAICLCAAFFMLILPLFIYR